MGSYVIKQQGYTGWRYTYPSEKYKFVSWDDDIPNIWKNKTCSKPPTSYECLWCLCFAKLVAQYFSTSINFHQARALLRPPTAVIPTSATGPKRKLSVLRVVWPMSLAWIRLNISGTPPKFDSHSWYPGLPPPKKKHMKWWLKTQDSWSKCLSSLIAMMPWAGFWWLRPPALVSTWPSHPGSHWPQHKRLPQRGPRWMTPAVKIYPLVN